MGGQAYLASSVSAAADQVAEALRIAAENLGNRYRVAPLYPLAGRGRPLVCGPGLVVGAVDGVGGA
jgi:hypothetical protein